MKTNTFTVNNAGDPEPVIVETVCKSITIREDPSVATWPTTDYRIFKPTKTDTPLVKLAGESYVFDRRGGFFFPGDVAGYVETISGSTIFSQDEE
jgi:hypothetical protein